MITLINLQTVWLKIRFPERKMVAHHERSQKVGIRKVKFPTSNIGTAQINMIVNDLPLTCSLFAGTLHLRCSVASGLSQEIIWIVAHYLVSIRSDFLMEDDYMGSKMKIYPEKL